ncbi:MFS transporter [Bowdeniella nasicola]|uniref:MFS transporter n=1 Tax=Bowdeniella nasicola TaxID=208480 RepID=A0A1Q5PZJ1_9ACTO|nr:MFS transporter [Bowdeniella nasicola]OKL52957.1 MFS transporter [Bowdeniella nasicola]
MTADTPAVSLPLEGRAALRAGVVGNWIDNIHVFLPVMALAPAMTVLAGPDAAALGAVVVIAMLLGRPLGGIIFGRISDTLGRTRTTRLAIAGTAACALGIAVMPTYLSLGAATLGLILILRFLGGIFVAGEYSAAIPLAMEWSQPRRRGLMSGLILSMAPWAQATIAFATAALLTVLGEQSYATWGWRSLFVAGVLASLGMLIYYTRHVADAPVFHRQHAQTSHERAGLPAIFTGRYAPMFWQVFTLMSGLWLLTDVTVLILPGRLVADAGLSATQTPIIMGIASVAQAIFMALAGHSSSITGRRTLFISWMLVAAVVSPFLWLGLMGSSSAVAVAGLAALLQVVTVSAYGPVAAYLSERFPTQVRSAGYGLGYSLSLILPALYPFYLPTLEDVFGRQAAPILMLVLGATLVIVGALLGPRLSSAEFDADIDDVANHRLETMPAGRRTT